MAEPMRKPGLDIIFGVKPGKGGPRAESSNNYPPGFEDAALDAKSAKSDDEYCSALYDAIRAVVDDAEKSESPEDEDREQEEDDKEY